MVKHKRVAIFSKTQINQQVTNPNLQNTEKWAEIQLEEKEEMDTVSTEEA